MSNTEVHSLRSYVSFSLERRGEEERKRERETEQFYLRIPLHQMKKGGGGRKESLTTLRGAFTGEQMRSCVLFCVCVCEHKSRKSKEKRNEQKKERKRSIVDTGVEKSMPCHRTQPHLAHGIHRRFSVRMTGVRTVMLCFSWEASK